MTEPRPASAVSNDHQNPGLTYADSGVDTEAGDRAVELMKSAVAATHSPNVLGGFGGFAGLFDASELLRYRRPLLASSTDGVGTKVALAQAMDIHDTIGQDLVGMVVDDIVVCGAKPLVMTDYIACGKVYPERIAAIVAGIAVGCSMAGVALVGGETAEHPGLLGPDEYDVAGAATGVVEADEMLGAHRVKPGAVLVAMGSSGVHSNGYSLVRRVIANAGWAWDRHVDELGRTIGQELLTPTTIYAKVCVELAPHVQAFTHITGGGLAANLARVLPQGTIGVLDRTTWAPNRVFSVLQELGGIDRAAMEATFNMGVGMIAVVDTDQVDHVVHTTRRFGMPAWVCGAVEPWDGQVDSPEVVTGSKGVQAGAAKLVGDYSN